MNFSALFTILVIFGPVSAEFTLLTITPFAAMWQKLAWHHRYLRISWTYLVLLYRFGSGIGGDDYPDICLAIALGMTFSLCSAVWQRIVYHEAAFKRLNGNNLATFCSNVVNFRPIIFTLLKCAIFAAIWSQFDDNLYSSPWLSETDQFGRSQFWF